MVPEVWSDKFFSHPRPFFCCFTPLTAHKMKISKNEKSSWRYHNFTQLYQKSWSYVILFLRYCTWWIYFLFFILGYTFPFYPSNSPKNQNLKKKKKKWKKCLEISSFCTTAWKIMIICYTVPEIWHKTDVIGVFHFGLFFALLSPNSPKNQNLKKIKNVPVSCFYTCVPKIMISWCTVPEIWCTTDGGMDRWADWPMDRWTDQRTGRWTDGRTGGWADGYTDRKSDI